MYAVETFEVGQTSTKLNTNLNYSHVQTVSYNCFPFYGEVGKPRLHVVTQVK